MLQSVREYALDTIRPIWEMDKRQLSHQILNLLLIVCSAVMIWKGLVVLSGSESPVVVVLSESMEPAFYRGDILFLWLEDYGRPHHDYHNSSFRPGDIVVFKIKDRVVPIVHRVIEVHEKENGNLDILTKGDNNLYDDRALYPGGVMWLSREDILGKAKGYLSTVGMITIYLTEYPVAKYVLVGLMGLLVVTTRE